MIQNLFVQFAELLLTKITDAKFQEAQRMKEKNFTRNRKIGFLGTFLLVLQASKRGLTDAISVFLSKFRTEYKSYTNAAFCKARQKIRPEAYLEIMRFAAQKFYELFPVRTFRGFRVLAVDGSDLNLPNTPELSEVFGAQNFQGGSQVQALLSTMYDVLNHVIVDASVESVSEGNERKMAMEHFSVYDSIKSGKDIITADRGYPSEKLLNDLEQRGLHYVIRCNEKEFWREVRLREEGEDVLISRKLADGKTLDVRVITLLTESGNREILLTNLFGKEYDTDFFKEVYRLRWKIESNYNLLKNNMQLENFSGWKPVCILQDIYAQLFLMNAAAMLEAEMSDQVEKRNSDPERKNKVAINRVTCIRLLKDNVIELLMDPSNRKTIKLMKKIRRTMLQNMTTVKEKNSSPRTRKHKALKFNNHIRAI